ncbi:tetratricopeptide (TPR) repeat protein [Confluentimicrobium naphthalenivorans]|uniref:Tetratricopeptide (TPR) repeat protein n=1 Tax=Actibacterium naphthalenivorans TaxID=1614693 RepID=A0A840C9N2_9RHOB|nr:tetratricopeptide (TPR) repeat protein [Actibacterium naphthalenivorans]
MRVFSIRSFGLAACVALSLVVAAPVSAQNGLAGAYLAARHASYFSDYKAAAQYYTQALARDPSNPNLMESALLAFTGLGQVERAVPIARRMVQGGLNSQAAHLVLMADQLKRGAFDAVLEDAEAGRSIGPLVDNLISAWSHFGEGRMSEALAAFDAAAGQAGLAVFGLYHKALALAAVGDFEGAAELFSGDDGRALLVTRRSVLADVEILSQLERNPEAVTLIDDIFGLELDPGLSDLRDRLIAGETLPFTTIRNAQDGAAEVFFTVAGALNGEANDTFTLLYSRIAEYLRPDHVDAMLLTASLLEAQEQFDLATAAYLQVPNDDPAFYAAELGRAETLEESGRTEAAIEVLTQLSKSHSGVVLVHVSLGDMLSRLKRYGEAVVAYDQAAALFGEPEPSQWVVYYARGIALEREKRWPEAEADFRKALELQPDQPRVLNYLGYSYVEMGTNLDEALSMIERAVEGRPDDGYITDSLGWVLYRLGRYQEAVAPMERAAELLPIDPIVNDHLGDVLWAVGRRLEAEFQWKRALSFDPEETDAQRIRHKLDVGLDKVREEEGLAPISVANGD